MPFYTLVMLETINLFLLQISSPSCLNITFCPATSHHFWPQRTTSSASSQNMALTCVLFSLRIANLRWVVSELSTP